MKLPNFGPMIAVQARRSLKYSNYGIMMLSLGLAVGLWLVVNAGEHASVMEMDVPISYRTLPAGMVIMNHPPDFVKIEVTGTRALLSLLESDRPTLKLDLAGVALGSSDFKIYPAMFTVPRSTTVTRISPDQITLDIDHVVSRELPVHLSTLGKVAPAYQIKAIEIKPPTVQVSGPSRLVSQITQADTEPFDVKGLTTDTDRAVELVVPNAGVRFSTVRVEARVDVAEIISDREFRAVEVAVKDSDYKYRVEPKHVSLTIRGPESRLADFDPKGVVYVDAKGMTPGSRELALQVNLPDGMQLVRQSPEKVKLRTYREKRVVTADEHPS